MCLCHYAAPRRKPSKTPLTPISGSEWRYDTLSKVPVTVSRVAESAERIVYRVAGLPVAVAALSAASTEDDTDTLRSAFAWSYWHPQGFGDWSELLVGILAFPFVVALASGWYTWRNRGAIRSQYGKKMLPQVAEQLKLYRSDGVLAPWYYIFSLHEEGSQRAPTFLQRFETKRCLFPLLKSKKGTPLNDKGRFAAYCQEHGIRCVPTLLELEGHDPGAELPDCDLFVKPSTGRGGRGAERWDCIERGIYVSPAGEQLTGADLLHRLVSSSRRRPLLIQPRLTPHPELEKLTAGALPTLRVLTCLNESDEPEVVAAMLRTSFGKNRTVDNLHAGGIGALVDLKSGALSRSSNLGADARLGWFSTHPDTGAQIEGTIVPRWNDTKEMAVAAHRHFRDRVVVGWDISILPDGPIFIEGNGNPDLDILQRFMPVGLRKHRFGELLAYHLKRRGFCASSRPEATGARPYEKRAAPAERPF